MVTQCDLGRRLLQAADWMARRLPAGWVTMSQPVTESPFLGSGTGSRNTEGPPRRALLRGCGRVVPQHSAAPGGRSNGEGRRSRLLAPGSGIAGHFVWARAPVAPRGKCDRSRWKLHPSGYQTTARSYLSRWYLRTPLCGVSLAYHLFTWPASRGCSQRQDRLSPDSITGRQLCRFPPTAIERVR